MAGVNYGLRPLPLNMQESHGQGMRIADKNVEQVSQYTWLVASDYYASDNKYTVVKCLTDAEELKNHPLYCAVCQLNESVRSIYPGARYIVNESFCEECNICCSFYECDCVSIVHPCKHIHKVHNWTEKVVSTQWPSTWNQNIKSNLEQINKLGKQIASSSDRGNEVKADEFAKSLKELVDKFSKK